MCKNCPSVATVPGLHLEEGRVVGWAESRAEAPLASAPGLAQITDPAFEYITALLSGTKWKHTANIHIV